VQVDEMESPPLAQSEPAGHASQAEAPEFLWYLPASQLVHAVACDKAYCPEAQVEYADRDALVQK